MIYNPDSQPATLNTTSAPHQALSNRLAGTSAIASGINQWMYDITKWLSIIERWEKESHLILKLVSLTTIGQDEIPSLNVCTSALNELFLTDVEDLKKQLLALECRNEQMSRNKLVYERKIQQYKSHLRSVAKKYDQLKHEILEELAHSYPLTII